MRVLIIRFSSLGDLVLLTPLPRELKKAFPGASVELATSTNFASLFENNPHLDAVNCLQIKPRVGNKQSIRHFALTLAAKQFDLIIDAHGSLRSRVLKHLIKFHSPSSPAIVTVRKRYRLRYLLTLPERLRPKGMVAKLADDALPWREAFLELLNKIEPPPAKYHQDASTELFPDAKHRDEAADLLGGNETIKWVAFAPSARHELKEWGVDNFAELIRALPSAVRPVIVGGTHDKACNELLEKLPGIKTVFGKHLLVVAAVLERCIATATNDSAILHISEAVGTPVVAVFGPTVKEFGFAPFLPASQLLSADLSCRPCTVTGKGKCSNAVHKKCMKDISPQSVQKSLLPHLK